MNDMELSKSGTFVGRVWLPQEQGPALVAVRAGVIFDITSKDAPTMRDLAEMDDPVGFVRAQEEKRSAISTMFCPAGPLTRACPGCSPHAIFTRSRPAE